MYQQIIRKEFQNIEATSLKNHQSLPDHLRKQLFSSALCPCTHHKNRYPDILPFEPTRVRLQYQGTEGSDYINANFLFERQYISCQAPIFSTFSDFWRMIWEQKCSVIVMLTRLLESGKTKANIYWPLYLNVPTRYGEISVTMIEEEERSHFTIRSFFLARGDQFHTVHQIHYTEWPDFGTPSTTRGIRDLVSKTNEFQQQALLSNSPLVVHCSAGIGRAGTFIAIHKAIELIEREQKFEVEALVKRMRQDRWGMVQTEKQYEFIYQAIHDYHADRKFFMLSEGSEEEDTECDLSYSTDSSCSSTPTTSVPSSPVSSPTKSNWRLTSAENVNTLRVTSATLSFA